MRIFSALGAYVSELAYDDNKTTDIDALPTATETTNNVWYDLQGRRATHLQRGRVCNLPALLHTRQRGVAIFVDEFQQFAAIEAAGRFGL